MNKKYRFWIGKWFDMDLWPLTFRTLYAVAQMRRFVNDCQNCSRSITAVWFDVSTSLIVMARNCFRTKHFNCILTNIFVSVLVGFTSEIRSLSRNFFFYNIIDGFIVGMAAMILHALCLDSKDLVDVQSTLDDVKLNEFDSIAVKMISNPVYIKRMGELCRDLVDLNYL